MDFLVRDVTLDDAAQIVSVFNPIISAGIYTVLDAPLTVEDQLSYIAGLSDRAICHVAECRSDGSVIGFQSMKPFPDQYTHAFDHVGVIGTWVDVNYHRQGVAKRLFGAYLKSHQAKDTRRYLPTFAQIIPLLLPRIRVRAFASLATRIAKQN